MTSGRRVLRRAVKAARRLYALATSRSNSRATLARSIRIDPFNMRAMQRLLMLEGRTGGHFSRAAALVGLISQLPQRYENGLAAGFSASNGQLLQDLLAAVLFEGEQGYFVEVGVGEGKLRSNTYYLEKELGWRGLLVEPNAEVHASIRAQRSAALCGDAAYHTTGEELEFLDVTGDRELSTLVDHIPADHHQRKGAVRRVRTVTLDDALARHGAPAEIAFMSIDTEGSEYEVLQGLDLTRWRVKLFAIEYNFDEDRRRKILAHLGRFGYRQILEGVSQFDLWLVHDSVALEV